MTEATEPSSGWEDATQAALLFAVNPVGLGGIALRAGHGPVRDQWLALLRAALPETAPMRKIPLGIPDTRLLGGLDLTATLQAGAPVMERGLLAEAASGVVVLAMAERLSAAVAGRLTAALDGADPPGCVALDEGAADDERPPAALLDRLAFHLDLGSISPRDSIEAPDLYGLDAARERLPGVSLGPDLLEALCATAVALGVASIRAILLALDAARASAALGGRRVVAEEDAILAGRLVFAPRATRLPPPPPDEQTEPAPPQEPAENQPQDSKSSAPAETDAKPQGGESDGLTEIMVEATKAAIPAGLLAALVQNQAGAARSRESAGRAGAFQKSGLRGRPSGIRAEVPRAGARLNVLETIRAAAPWQQIRRQETGGGGPRLAIRRSDFRVTRLSQRRETTTIFLVDASGSAALQRLSEAKGAVEMLLADCYVRRDQVALFAFRGRGAQLLLPPTRSLVRAKRSLAGLPGGGGTPLAAGLDAGVRLAEAVRRKGGSPTIVLLTDGRANIARDGTSGRARAMQEATDTARQIRLARLTALLVDTSPRPDPAARALAKEMSARYLPLPYADPAFLSRSVRETAT